MSDTITMEAVRMKFRLLQPLMTERLRRQWAACEAESLGRGGVSLVAQATGLSRTTIWAGRRELRQRAERPRDDLTPERVRAPGGGRHLIEQTDVALLGALRDLVESSTRGDPQSPLFWTSKSTRTLAEELSGRRHPVSHQTVAALLTDWGYSLQANRKTKEGEDHPDRDAQFEYINRRVRHLPTAGSAGHLGGCEEEGIGRGFPQSRTGVAAGRPARGGPRQGLQGQAVGQGNPRGGL